MKFCLDFIILFLHIYLVRILENYLIYIVLNYIVHHHSMQVLQSMLSIYCTDISNISFKSTTKNTRLLSLALNNNIMIKLWEITFL